jgi:hypothetical protein
MTGAEYAALGASLQAAIVALIKSVVVNEDDELIALVLDRDPVSLDEAQWLGALKTSADLDENNEKRAHAWIVTFAASEDLATSQNRSIAPIFKLKVQVFYSHDFGTDADNSEKRIRDEVLKVQLAFAQAPKLIPRTKHRQLEMRIRLMKFPAEIVHRGEGELVVENDAFNVY